MCVGVSSYRPTRDDGIAEATDAALEELVSAVGLKISDPFFRENVMPVYSDVRAKALSALQTADLEPTSEGSAATAHAAADDLVRKARKHVVEVLQLSGGAAVPAQRSDWYWEEYARENGKGNEVLVFVRYDVSLDAVRALVDKYSAVTPVMGSSAMTAFPALAWHYPELHGWRGVDEGRQAAGRSWHQRSPNRHGRGRTAGDGCQRVRAAGRGGCAGYRCAQADGEGWRGPCKSGRGSPKVRDLRAGVHDRDTRRP